MLFTGVGVILLLLLVFLAGTIGLFLGMIPGTIHRWLGLSEPLTGWFLPIAGAFSLAGAVMFVAIYGTFHSSESKPATAIVIDVSSRDMEKGGAIPVSHQPVTTQPVMASAVSSGSHAGAVPTIPTLRARHTSDKPPTWISAADAGKSSPALRTISSEWFASTEEALAQATARTGETVNQLFVEKLGSGLQQIPTELLEQSAISDCQVEQILKDFGNNFQAPMYRAHVLLNVDTSPVSALYRAWVAHLREVRILRLGTVALCLTMCLAGFAQLLRWNLGTQSRYWGRLTFAASTLTMAAVAVATWFPDWLINAAIRKQLLGG